MSISSKNRSSNHSFVSSTKMRAGRKTYDTGTAKLIAFYVVMKAGGKYWGEKLYRKRSGEYFLYSHDGLTKDLGVNIYGQVTKIPEGAFCWYDGFPIIQPMTQEQVKEWARKRDIHLKK